MKKLWFCSILVLAIAGISTPIYAHPTKADSVKRVYATSEEILLDMMRPSISKFVNDNYGHEVHWADPRITDVKSEVRANNWTYEVSLMIKVDDLLDQYDSFGLDKLTLKINSTRNKSKASTNESDILLMDYKKILTPKMEMRNQ
ncbi:MAG: hypothetical protein ACQEXQ_29160 [Bacillota bacterium]